MAARNASPGAGPGHAARSGEVMAQIVCVLGNKGGTGKTTLSHMISHGMALLGKRVVCVLTDLERERLSKDNRLYLPFDARDAGNLAKVVATLNGVSDWFGVIDGGGNRSDTDSHLANLADLVLLPFRDSHEDMRTVQRDLEWIPRAWGLPSQWPADPPGRRMARASLDTQLGAFGQRLLDPIPHLPATKLLLQDRIPTELPWQLTNACVALAMQVCELLDVQYESAKAFAAPRQAPGKPAT